MIKFTTPAFVRCNNPQERKELIEWLRSIGYSLTYGAQVSDIDNGKEFVEVVSGTVYVAKWGNSFRDYNAHDCDENINLFKQIRQFDVSGNLVSEYFGSREAAKLTGISQGNISMCCLGQRHSAGGYIWKYKNQQP